MPPQNRGPRPSLSRHGRSPGTRLLADWLAADPAAAAVSEAREEISADVQLIRLVDVLGGPDYEVSYDQLLSRGSR